MNVLIKANMQTGDNATVHSFAAVCFLITVPGNTRGMILHKRVILQRTEFSASTDQKESNAMPVNVYVNFNGNCREAVEFYAEVFDTDAPKILTFGEVPPDPGFPIPEDAKDFIMHASLNIKGNSVMFSDIFPGSDYTPGNNISLTVTSDNLGEILSLYRKLKQDGTVDMDLQETFWSKRYASLTDKFGIPWQLIYQDNV